MSTAAAVTIADGARRALQEHLFNDARLQIPQAVIDQGYKVSFTPSTEQPFLPTSLQMTESSSSLWALLGLMSNLIAEKRYGFVGEDVVVDIYGATLFLMSAFIFTSEGRPITHPDLLTRGLVYDIGKIGEPYRGHISNIWKTKDNKFYHLHGGIDTTGTLNALGLPQHRPDLDEGMKIKEIKAIYASEVAKHESRWLDIEINEHWRQEGSICLTAEEFANTPHGRVVTKEPLYTVEQKEETLPALGWPAPMPADNRPLAGIRVVDLTRVIAGPTISRILALLGADVLRISSDNLPDTVLLFDTQVGKRDTNLNLKTAEGKKTLEELIKGADVVLDGYRPGALARLGFGETWVLECAKRRGRGIVHASENCYGWKGEWSHRSGWQQISDVVSGVAWAQGNFLGLDEPVVPLLPNSDYQTGLVGAIGILQALLRRAESGGSYIVKTSLTQYNLWFMNLGLFDEETCETIRQRNPDIKLGHNTDLLVMVQLVAKSSKQAAGEGPGKLWDPERFTKSPMLWGRENEMANHVDWAKIVQFKDQDGQLNQRWSYDYGTCKPGSHAPEWAS